MKYYYVCCDDDFDFASLIRKHIGEEIEDVIADNTKEGIIQTLKADEVQP